MLCHQMTAMHRAAMKQVARCLNSNLPPVEMARLSNSAATHDAGLSGGYAHPAQDSHRRKASRSRSCTKICSAGGDPAGASSPKVVPFGASLRLSAVVERGQCAPARNLVFVGKPVLRWQLPQYQALCGDSFRGVIGQGTTCQNGGRVSQQPTSWIAPVRSSNPHCTLPNL
jgi:hypothetical protein